MWTQIECGFIIELHSLTSVEKNVKISNILFINKLKNVNKAMKRNIEGFPEDFCFQLTIDDKYPRILPVDIYRIIL